MVAPTRGRTTSIFIDASWDRDLIAHLRYMNAIEKYQYQYSVHSTEKWTDAAGADHSHSIECVWVHHGDRYHL